MPEQAVAGVLAEASGLGAGPYLAVAFGFFMLVTLVLQQRRDVARDASHQAALADALAMVADMNSKRVEEMREVMRCTRDGINGAVLEIEKSAARSFSAIRETNAELISGFSEVVRELKPVLTENTSVLAQARMVVQGALMRNGHG